MATRKFLTSVADVYAYDESDNIVFTAKTLLDSSIEISLGSQPVRGGRGNQLQYVYYHTGEMNFTLTDAQWNLLMLGATVGSDGTTGENVYTEENVQVTVTGNTVTATVTGTPLAWAGGATIYGWIETPDGYTYKGTFSGSDFTATKSGSDTLATNDYACIRFYHLNSAASSYTVNANMIPKVVRLVMEAQLNSADVVTNKIGIVQIIAPTVTLSGAFSISMSADGVSNTPLTGMALAYTDPAGSTTPCSEEPYYAKIVEILDNANWYDNVIALAIEGGDFGLTHPDTSTLSVWAVPSVGLPFKPPVADLTFSSGTPATATIGTNTGVVTTVATGTTLLDVYITSVSSIEASCTLTVS